MCMCAPFSLAQPPHLNPNRTSCTTEDFVCRADARACVPRVQWQDGVDDCTDGSDECELYGESCVRAFPLEQQTVDPFSNYRVMLPVMLQHPK
jgi:hypothetical protein